MILTTGRLSEDMSQKMLLNQVPIDVTGSDLDIKLFADNLASETNDIDVYFTESAAPQTLEEFLQEDYDFG